MLNAIIRFSLHNRMLVLAGALVLALSGILTIPRLPVDVFPDLTRPTVTIMAEAPGLAPEEVEPLVTFRIESLLNGATGVQRVRSASGIGLSIVWVEFEWGTDIYRDRQVVAEKLQLAAEQLPRNVHPVMAPITSIMGEIMLVGLSSPRGTTDPLELRTLAEWVVRPRLLSVPGVAQVTVMGGGLKQYQVITNPERLAQYDVTLQQLTDAVEAANVNAGGSFLLHPTREEPIRITGRVETLDQIANAVVVYRPPAPVLVKNVATVQFGHPVKRGDGSADGKSAVILSIQKQPTGDTLTLTREITQALTGVRTSLPKDVEVAQVFRQADFIQAAIDNVQEAIRDGSLFVVLVLFLVLWNFRTSLINLTAIPMSIIITALVFHGLGLSINTMTLGGLAVAIGELVDDSIVDVENIFRRLKENRRKADPEPALTVIEACSEVRNSIVYATLIIVLVMVPLFYLPGLEGRMFAPLALAYILTLVASLVVSLTITPALSSVLLPRARMIAKPDTLLLRGLKAIDRRLLKVTLRHPWAILTAALLLVVVACGAFRVLGGEFLPPFNEGTVTVNLIAVPGTSLEESDRLGNLAEGLLHEVPEVVSTARRTGRAEQDEHAEGVNSSEIDVHLRPAEGPKPGRLNRWLRAIPLLHSLGVKPGSRPRAAILADIRDRLTALPGVAVNIGQPIAHRLDHILSGVQAKVAVKVFGPDLSTLRLKAQEIADQLNAIPGVVEPQVETAQVRVQVKRPEASRYGLSAGEVAKVLETALQGRTVSEILEEGRTFDLVVWFDKASRNDISTIQSTLISTPSGVRIPLGQVAEVFATTGPNTINRENVTRRIVVSCNTAGRDLAGVIGDIQAAVKSHVNLDAGYWVEYGGQFQSQQEATRILLLLGAASILGVFLLLVKALGSWRAALQCLVNLPLAAVGGVVAIYLTDRILSVASLVGFITLVGIVTRNGIMMIAHYIHLMNYEGERFDEQMIIRGSQERLAPVLMTALCAAIGLIPLALGAGQTGKEILHPLAVVVIGGLVSSTLLDQVATPALFFQFGRKVYEPKYGPPTGAIVPPAAEPDRERLATDGATADGGRPRCAPAPRNPRRGGRGD